MHAGKLARTATMAGLIGVVIWSVPMTTPAHAVTTPVYATWTLAGSGGAYNGTMTLGPGFPVATFTSDSRASADLPTGASTWLPAGTPAGAVFGSSQNRAYVNLRPAADNASSPSTTTYTFGSPIQPGGWAFVLGGNFRLTIPATGTFQGAALDIQVPLPTGEVAPIVLAAAPPVSTVAPGLPATGRRATGATSLVALGLLGVGSALAWTGRRRARP